ASVPPAADGLLFVPYLAGERAPIWRTDVRGALLGIAAADSAAELARAVVMGVCLSELHVLATAEDELGAAVDEVEVGGRGTSEPPWQEARLAALGRPLRLVGEPDPAGVGAGRVGGGARGGG